MELIVKNNIFIEKMRKIIISTLLYSKDLDNWLESRTNVLYCNNSCKEHYPHILFIFKIRWLEYKEKMTSYIAAMLGIFSRIRLNAADSASIISWAALRPVLLVLLRHAGGNGRNDPRSCWSYWDMPVLTAGTTPGPVGPIETCWR